MALNFIDSLNAARRRALLTGQPMTSQEKQGMNAGWFDAAAATANRRKAQEIAEKQAEDRLAQERWAIQEQMDAAKKAQTSELTGNIVNTAVNTLGMDWLKSKPGESMISKGWQAGKEGVGKVANWWGPGDGATTPTFTSALNAPAGTDLTGIGGFAPEGGMALAPEAYAGAGADLTGLAGAGAEGAGVGTGATLGGVGTAALAAAPYAVGGYYAAKLGGKWLEDTANKNKGGKVGAMIGRTIQDPLAGIGKPWVRELIKDEGTRKTINTVMDVLNPIGWVLGGK